jgi:branched-chain amino acid transport system ATP-binding protein
MKMAFLSVNDLTKDFGGLRAINRLNFAVDQGELVGIVGPNGSGKTTCFNMITGFLKPTGGNILFKGSSIAGEPPHKVAAQGICRTFQLTSLFPELTVQDNVLLGLHLRLEPGIAGPLIRTFFMTRGFFKKEKWAKSRAEELMGLLELLPKRNELAKNLPGPDQRRLEIAVALGLEPQLLLLDEPVAGMRPDETDKVGTIIRQLIGMGYTILIVEHNMRFIMTLCQRILVLNNGIKIAEGTPEQIYTNPEVRRVYLGGEG